MPKTEKSIQITVTIINFVRLPVSKLRLYTLQK